MSFLWYFCRLVLVCLSLSTCGGRSIQGTINGRFRRIVGGHVVPISDHPYLVSVQYNGQNMGQRVKTADGGDQLIWIHLCGGAVIEGSWILTAAHCFVMDSNPANYRIVFGVQNLSNSGEAYSVFVTKIIMHANFNNTLPGFPNDIALLIPASSHSALNLASVELPEYKGSGALDNCHALGWGDRTGYGQQTDMGELEETAVKLIQREACVSMWAGEKEARVTSRQLCGRPGKHATCDGDSGGPLVCSNGGRHHVVGIISWGQEGCSDPKRPSVFTDVRSYLPWIEKHLI